METKFVQSKVVSKNVSAQAAAKQKKQLIFLGFLVPLFLFLIYSNIIAPSKARKRPAPNPAATQSQSVESGSIALNPSAPVSAPSGEGITRTRSDSEWGRSPFSLKSEQLDAETTLAFRLQGIVYDGTDSYAVIDRIIVRVNDQIADKSVKKITKKDVTLQSPEGEILVLRI